MTGLIAVVLTLIASLGYGQGKLVVDSSSVSFRIKNAGITVNGTLAGLETQLAFNPKKLKSSSIVASVDASSVDTGIRIRNNHLRKSDYLNVAAYPRITMTSTNFQKNGDGQFLGDFIIHLKGKEGKVSLPFTFQKEGAYYILRGSFEINRKDYDVGGKSLILDDRVQVNILVKAKETE
jgi:polyisoprenoid-binding protein YceI